MPLEISQNQSPYFNDFDPLNDYYQHMFKAGVSVQTRELNGMGSMFQHQIESFADNIFKKGTIVDGCNFNFYNEYAYAKVLDNDIDSNSVVPSLWVGYFAKNEANLIAYVINSKSGFEATTPDLNTIYLNYVNSGNTGNLTSFTPNETITIYDGNKNIPSVSVVAGGVNFSNSDVVVYSPVVAVKVTTGTYSNGDYICQPSTGANLEIIEADYDTLALEDKVLLRVKPRNADLANASVNSISWTIDNFATVTDATNAVAATVTDVYGTGFSAGIITNGIGKILEVIVSDPGQDFEYIPHVNVQSANNLSGINALTLAARNYYSKVKIAAGGTAVGNGYAFSVSDGRIYQKGFFARVNAQTIIVDKYSSSPNNVVVGFNTVEEYITSNIDTSLLDNNLGTENETAPGADRLKLTPQLVVLDKEDAIGNTEFNALVEWSNGQPFKQNRTSQYSRIGQEMAQRTFDESGNFVVDTFQVATTSVANTAKEGNTYTVVVDPGQAYISGFPVQTLRNFYIDVDKGIDTLVANNTVSLNFGNYVRINQVGGLFQFSTAAEVDIYDTAKTFLSNTALVNAGNTDPVGTKIGTARMRSLIPENGIAGDPAASFRLFLFDIKMNPGKNFASAKSFYYNGSSNKGVADIILTPNPTSGANVAVLEGSNNDKLLFSAGVESLKNSSNTNYIYRTIDQTRSFGNNGILTKSIAASPDEFYPYTGNLSSSQLKELYVVPIANTLFQYLDLTGTISVGTGSNVVTGTGTSFFNDFAPGDYVYAYSNGTASEIKKVVGITNATSMQVDSVYSFANAVATFKRVFPKNVPIPFGSRTGLTGNVDSNNNILTLQLNHANGLALTLEGTTSVNTAIAVNIKRTNVASSSKTTNRKQFVKVYCGNNAGNTAGPWCVGVPDICRLRNVYVGNSSVSNSSPNVTRAFYIDHNQTANYLDLGWLYKRPGVPLALANTDYLLVEFDYYTRGSEGYFDTVSYLGTSNTTQITALNSLPLANLSAASPSFEVPEVYTVKGEYYDLLNQLDFRPAVSNTVAPNANSALAPLNPNVAISFGNTADPSNDKKFPLPDSALTTTVTHYLGRVDSVFISGESGEIYTLKGIPAVDPRKRYAANHPKDSLKLQTISVPSYPNITDNISAGVAGILSTNIANERYSNLRLKAKVITVLLSSDEFQLSQPMTYTMEDIANLERRIKDLEYYVSLSILETSITNKIIPSSIDGSLNRFKFGFFADDFSTEFYSDTDNPQYAASIETEGDQPFGISKSPLDDKNWADADKISPDSKLLSPTKLVQKSTNRVVPPKFIWTVPHAIENLSYVDQEIISQDFATSDELGCIPKTIPANNAPEANGYFASVYSEINSYNSANKTYIKTEKVRVGGLAGNISFYFNNQAFTKFTIYKNGVVVGSTSSAANTVNNLTQAEIAKLEFSAAKTGWNKTIPVAAFSRTNDFVLNTGKISIPHSPANGVDYDILIEQTASKGYYQLMMEYPLTTVQRTETIVSPCVTVEDEKVTPPVTVFTGTMFLNKSSLAAAWACSKNFKINNVTLRSIRVEVTGLKPNTVHKFYVDGQDLTAQCTPTYGINISTNYNRQARDIIANLGKPLLSEPDGKLHFIFNAPISQSSWLQTIASSSNKAGVTFGSSGYTTLLVQATNSVASKLVAQRTNTSTLAVTPAGAP